MTRNIRIKASIVIPAYNEEEGFQSGVLDEVQQFLSKAKFSWEVILVDDGSVDRTYKLLREFAKRNPGFKVMRITHGGKAAAVSAGVFRASGEYVFFSDFDQSTPMDTVGKFMEEFKRGADVVIADRYLKGARRTNDSFMSRLRSKVFNLAVRFLLLPGLSDTQCGFKAFRGSVAKKLFKGLKVHNRVVSDKPFMGSFDVELLFLAKKAGLKIVSVPVVWKRVPSSRLTIVEPIRMLFDIARIKWFDFLGRYGRGRSPISLFDKLFPLFLVFLFTIPAIFNMLQPGYFAMHDDMQAMRQLQMDKCFQDLQIPCRWVPDLGYGYGYPLFNFYPPMPYLLGQVFHPVGFSFLNTIKILFALSFLASAFTMYVFAKEFWGRLGGVVSAVFYIWAPYHIVDVYVRGAMNESWALAWFPGVLWAIYKVIREGSWRYVVLLAFFGGMLALSHNPMMMVFAPGAVLWGVFWMVEGWVLPRVSFPPVFVSPTARTRACRDPFHPRHPSLLFDRVKKLSFAGVWAFGLAAFFTLPVIFESKFAHLETLVIGYFNYLAHFVDLRQMFVNRDWGYGASFHGTEFDDMSFQIGHLHWILSFVALGIAWFLRKSRLTVSLVIVFFFLWIYGYAFMSHVRSTPIWQVVKPLEFLQFPWRFLSLVIVGASFLAGSSALVFNKSKRVVWNVGVAAVLIAGVVFLGKDYVTWREYYPDMTDESKFSGELWRLQVTSGIFDYLPIWAELPPADPAPTDAEFVEGQGEYETLFKNSKRQEYKVDVQEDGVFQINTFYFPGWKVFVDGQEVGVSPERDPELGRMLVDLSAGEHEVVAKFTNSLVRTIGNNLSLVSWLVLIVFLVVKTRPLGILGFSGE